MYPFSEVEKKWQEKWDHEKAFAAHSHAPKPKAYILEMLPYPSGNIHMGHVRNYTIGDAIAHYMRAKGYEVLHPQGWDAFGLPAENAAIENQIHPRIWTTQNIETMKEHLRPLGFSYDWSREVDTSDVRYYGQEQKLFLDFYKNGLAFRKECWVNWDPVENSVLANEQVINGRGWRSGALVERRKLTQWSLRITDYAERLLLSLKDLKGWPEKVVRMQENWIGRSEGVQTLFTSPSDNISIDVFTTRPETLFGASFCAIAPSHPLAETLAKHDPQLQEFIDSCQCTATCEEAISTAEKKGYDTGKRVSHPFLPDQLLPLYVANFVLMDYGTGAIFGCPAHDERDFEFAQTYGLPIKPIIAGPHDSTTALNEVYTGPGTLVNSQFLDGLTVEAAREKMIDKMESEGIGKRHVRYRLRDWCVSRQRYWGCPIPIIYCDSCGIVPAKELPVELPEDVTFKPGMNPLAEHPTWKHVNCPQCGQPAVRETDTLDTFFESSWYFLRYCCPHSPIPIDKAETQPWVPVTWYIGGIEHAILHLLYARFFTKALKDLGYIDLEEPFQNLLTQGMVCHITYQDSQGKWLYPNEVMRQEGRHVTVADHTPVTIGRVEKMSKSKKNVVSPQDSIKAVGADAVRLFMLSDTPPERDSEWSDEGLEGCWRYLNRLWRLGELVSAYKSTKNQAHASLDIQKITHQTLEKITRCYDTLSFNKAIAFARELTRSLEDALDKKEAHLESILESFEILVSTLFPIIPHITSELYERIAPGKSLHTLHWPQIDASLATVETVTIAVQVNGKLRGSFETSLDTPQDALQEKALDHSNVQREIAGRPLKRVIIVPNRIVNVIV